MSIIIITYITVMSIFMKNKRVEIMNGEKKKNK